MATVTWAVSLFQAQSELEELTEETDDLRVELSRVATHPFSTAPDAFIHPAAALLTPTARCVRLSCRRWTTRCGS